MRDPHETSTPQAAVAASADKHQCDGRHAQKQQRGLLRDGKLLCLESGVNRREVCIA